MATIGTLNAKLTLQSAAFRAGMRQAIGQTNTLAASIRRSTLSMARFGASILGVGSVSAAIYGMSRLFKQFGDLADFSDMLSIDTKSLIGFQLAAEEAGVSADGLQDAIRKLLKTVGDAAAKGGTVAGLEAQGLLGLPTEEIFLRVGDAIGRIPQRASRAAEEVKAFGREGAKLDVLFRGGRSELEKYVAVVGRLGIGLTRMEVGKLDIVVEDMNRLFEAYKGLALTIATKLAPAIDERINTTALGVMAVTQWLKKEPPSEPTAEDRIIASLKEKIQFSAGGLRAKYQEELNKILMGPPAPPLERPESAFDRRVREDMERKQERSDFLDDVDNERGLKRLILGGGLRTLKEAGIVEGAQNGPAGGGAGKIQERQVTLLQTIAVTLGRIEKRNMGMAA